MIDKRKFGVLRRTTGELVLVTLSNIRRGYGQSDYAYDYKSGTYTHKRGAADVPTDAERKWDVAGAEVKGENLIKRLRLFGEADNRALRRLEARICALQRQRSELLGEVWPRAQVLADPHTIVEIVEVEERDRARRRKRFGLKPNQTFGQEDWHHKQSLEPRDSFFPPEVVAKARHDPQVGCTVHHFSVTPGCPGCKAA